MASFIVRLFFLQFWRQGRDRFFAFFAASFFVEALNRAALAFTEHPSDGAPVIYSIRFVAFLLILVAMADNRAR